MRNSWIRGKAEILQKSRRNLKFNNMKKVKIESKLSLKKETISKLDKSVQAIGENAAPTLASQGSCYLTCGTIICL